MMNYKKLSIGLVTATMLATPVMAQGVYREPGAMGSNYPNSRHVAGGYGVRATPGPGYYHRNRLHPAPRVGALAAAPRDNGPYGSLGLVERQW